MVSGRDQYDDWCGPDPFDFWLRREREELWSKWHDARREREREQERECDCGSSTPMFEELQDGEWTSIERAGEVALGDADREAILAGVNEYYDDSLNIEQKIKIARYVENLKEQQRIIREIKKLSEDLIKHLRSRDPLGKNFEETLKFKSFILNGVFDSDLANCVRVLGKVHKMCSSLQSKPVPKRRGRRPDSCLDYFVERILMQFRAAGGRFPKRGDVEAAEKDAIDLPVVGFVQAIGRAMGHPDLSLKEPARYRALKAIARMEKAGGKASVLSLTVDSHAPANHASSGA